MFLSPENFMLIAIYIFNENITSIVCYQRFSSYWFFGNSIQFFSVYVELEIRITDLQWSFMKFLDFPRLINVSLKLHKTYLWSLMILLDLIKALQEVMKTFWNFSVVVYIIRYNLLWFFKAQIILRLLQTCFKLFMFLYKTRGHLNTRLKLCMTLPKFIKAFKDRPKFLRF